ncbi:MAG: TIGR03936 family radical SAM-associated protein, partial [Oscillospiraceae bacterium]
MKFVSHLDMNRYMSRIIKLARIPVWFTEGFNPHIYITFALPLSLGFDSECECVDFKIIQDDFDDKKIIDAINAVATGGIEFFKVGEPQMKPSAIQYAEYNIEFDCEAAQISRFLEFLKNEHIIVSKKGKKGKITEIDMAEKIKSVNIFEDGIITTVKMILPAGSTENFNPNLLTMAFETEFNTALPPHSFIRKALFDADMQEFK